jgi:hypothetical protein
MHTKPHIAAGQTAHPWLTAEWVYDAIMRHIDEDLTTTELPGLSKKYSKESEGDRAQRRERYVRSFTVFEDALARLESGLVSQVRERRAQQQQHLQQVEQGQVDDISQMIDHFPSGK